ncbi:MAG: hypothetical protein AAGJ87_10875 [Pseudomonadota bacterium]
MRRWMALLSSLVGLAFVSSTAQATTLEQFTLDDLASRADKIFRGTVLDVEQGMIEMGGGEVPAVTYRLRVEEMMKGVADVTKGDASYVEVRMVGSIKAPERDDNFVRLSVFRDVPKLRLGSDYVLFMTPQSSAGLSVTVGLGQGSFTIAPTAKVDYAVNEFNNLGLGLSEPGPVTYDSLKAAIYAAMGR